MERLLTQIRQRKFDFLWGLTIGFFVLILFAGSYFRWLDIYELDLLDVRFRLRHPIPKTTQAVFIDIGDDTIRQLGQFPLERSYHASLIKALSEVKARAVVFDIFFSEPDSHDAELAAAIAEARNIYLPFIFDIAPFKKGKAVSSSRFAARTLPVLTQYAKGTGHINIIPDRDGKFRRVPLVVEYEEKIYPYLSFLVGCDLLGIPFENVTIRPGASLDFGGQQRWPLDENSTMVINFSGKWAKSYAHYSYVDVLRSYVAQFSGEKPLLDLNVFKDKVCLIGLTAEGTSDLHPNPFEPLYPSVGIHAEVLNAMLNKSFIVRVPRGINLALLFILIGLTAAVAWRARPIKALLSVMSLTLIFILLGILFFNFWGWWIDLFYPAVTVFIVYLFCAAGKSVLEWKKRLVLENELKIARQIQESFLPKILLQTPHLDIAAKMLTAREVGGDLYDCFTFDDGQVGVMIGDVTGKGVPASLFMAMVVASFRFYAAADVSPEETLRQLNEKLIKEVSSGLFATLFYAVFDTHKNMARYASAGHLPVLYLPKDGRARFLDVEDGLPVGMMKSKYSAGQLAFGAGDTFVFYTDGITEAKNFQEEMYGSHRLQELMERHGQKSVDALIRIIEDDVRRFEPSQRQHDDITYVVARAV